MIVTKAAHKITILMGLTIMQESKNFKSNKLLRIFRILNIISKNLVKHINNWGWADTRKCEELSVGVFMWVMNCKAVGTKYSRNNRENFLGIF